MSSDPIVPCQCGPGCECTGTKGGSCPCGCASKPPLTSANASQTKDGCQCGDGCSCAGTKGFACDCKAAAAAGAVSMHVGNVNGTPAATAAAACGCGTGCDCAGTKGGQCTCGKPAQAVVSACSCGTGCDCAGTKGGVCGCGTPAQVATGCSCGSGCDCAGSKGGVCSCAKPADVSSACACGSGCDCAGTKGGVCGCPKPTQTAGSCGCGSGCDCAGTKGGACECAKPTQVSGACGCGSGCDCAGTKGGVCGCTKPTEVVGGCNCGPACDCAGSKGGSCGCASETKEVVGACRCGSGCDCAGSKGGVCGCAKTEAAGGCNCGSSCDCAGTKGGVCGCAKPATKPRLIYFDQRGRAEVIRLLLAEAKVDYEDYRFPANSSSDSSQPNQAYETMRATGCLDWDQVPAFEVDGQVIVQSRAIERYIAARYGLVSKDPIEAAHADSVCEALTDISLALTKIVTGSPESRQEAMRDFVDVQLPKWGGLFEAKLKRCGTGFYGKTCSYADISAYYLWNMIDQHSAGYALKLFPSIKAHTVLIGNRPAIKTWVNSRPKTQF